MPRYFFRFTSGRDCVPDNVGTELRDLKAAHRHSIELIDKTVRFMSDVPEWRGWRIVIEDDAGLPLLIVLFPRYGTIARKVFGQRERRI